MDTYESVVLDAQVAVDISAARRLAVGVARTGVRFNLLVAGESAVLERHRGGRGKGRQRDAATPSGAGGPVVTDDDIVERCNNAAVRRHHAVVLRLVVEDLAVIHGHLRAVERQRPCRMLRAVGIDLRAHKCGNPPHCGEAATHVVPTAARVSSIVTCHSRESRQVDLASVSG